MRHDWVRHDELSSMLRDGAEQCRRCGSIVFQASGRKSGRHLILRRPGGHVFSDRRVPRTCEEAAALVAALEVMGQ